MSKTASARCVVPAPPSSIRRSDFALSSIGQRLFVALWTALILFLFSISSPLVITATAQDLNWSTDIGNVGTAGDSSFDTSTGAYHIRGAGAGLGGTADAFHFAYYEIVKGDGQMTVRLSSADALAQAALVIRESLDAGAPSTAVAVQSGTIRFVRRLTADGASAVGEAANAAVPCWLKLVRSGDIISAFMSSDGQTWSGIGSDTVSLGNSLIYAGLAVSNGAADATGTVMASFDSIRSTFLPGQGLLTWLKADAGVSADPSTQLVSSWADQSGNGNDATQATGSMQPQWVAGALNGLPILRFDGVDDQLSLATSLAADNFTIYAVAKPTASERLDGESTGGTPGTSGECYLFGAYPGAATQPPMWPDGAGAGVSMGTNGVSVYEHTFYYLPPLAVFPADLSTGFTLLGVKYQNRQPSIYLDGTQWHLGLASPQPHVHAPLQIGSGSFGAFAGDVAEVLLYDHALSDYERSNVEAYLTTKYALNSLPGAPGALAGAAITGSQISLVWQPAGAGGTPSGYCVERKPTGGGDFVEVVAAVPGQASACLDAGLAPGTYVYRVRAYNVLGYSDYSAEATVSIPAPGTLPDSLPALSDLALWLRPELGVTKDDNGLVSAWTDVSGHGNDARQGNASSQPQWVDAVINGQPVLRFDGNSDSLATAASVNTTNGNATILAMVRLPDASSRGAFVKNGLYGGFGFGVGAGSLDSYGNEAVGVFDYVRWLPTGTPWGTGSILAEMSLDASGDPILYRNGIQLGNLGSGGPTPSTGPTLIGGYQCGGARFLRGDIAEVLMFNRQLSDAERGAWENYLNTKYRFNPPPAMPTASAVTPLSATQVALSWNESSQGVVNYLIERQNANGSWTLVATVDGSTTQYIDGNLSPGQSYSYRITAVNNLGSSPVATASGNTPVSSPGAFPTSGMQLWFRADAGVGTDENGKVAQWIDASGNGHDLAQGNEGYRPTLVSGAYNGEPAVHFDGSSTSLVSNSAFDLLANSNDVSVIVVTNPGTSQPTYADMFDYEHTDIGFVYEQDGNNLNDFSPGFAPVQLQAGQLCVSSLVKGGTDCQVFFNGQMASIGSAPATLNPAPPRSFWMGNWYQGGRNYNGDIAELMIFNRALSDAERQTVETYLNHKYAIVGIPAAPSNPMVTAISTSQINLNWMASPQAVGYSIERKDSASDDSAYVEVATVAGGEVQAYLDGGLTAGASYTYRLRAYSLGGYSAYSAAISVTLPTTGVKTLPTDDLLLWLKPDTGVVRDVNGLISDWMDASGHGNDAYAMNGWQPQWVDDALNGQPVVRFNGSGSYLQLPSGFDDFTQGITAFVVAKPTSNASYARFFDLGNGGGNEDLVFARYMSSDGLQFFCPTPSNELVTDTGLSLNQYQILECEQDVSTHTTAFFKNGVQIAFGGNVGAIDNVIRNINYLGRSAWGDPFYQGDMAEVIIFNRSLTYTEREAVETYLNNKYAIISRPSAPTGVSVQAISDSQANLSWTASPAATGYSVERKEVAEDDSAYAEVASIAGGTVQAYIDGGLTPGSGYSYRIRAYNIAGYSDYSPTVNLNTPSVGVPALPIDDLLLWLKPEVGISQDASGFVNNWVDASGHGNDASAPAGNRPTWVNGAANGQPVLRFDGGNSYLQLPSGFSDFTQGMTALVVASRPLRPAMRGSLIWATARIGKTSSWPGFLPVVACSSIARTLSLSSTRPVRWN